METHCGVCGGLGVQVEVRAWGVAIRVCENGHKWVTRPEPGRGGRAVRGWVMDRMIACPTCRGSGKVLAGVPLRRIVKDSVGMSAKNRTRYVALDCGHEQQIRLAHRGDQVPCRKCAEAQ